MKFWPATLAFNRNPAFRVVLIYAVFGIVWILFGKYLDDILFSYSLQHVLWFETAKGLLFVAVSSSLIFLLVYNREKRLLSLNKDLLDVQRAIYKASIVTRSDKAGSITFVNDNFLEITGYTREEVMGKNHRIINSNLHPAAFWAKMWKTVSEGNIWRNEVRNKAKDGSFYWVDATIIPFFDENGDIKEYFSIRSDITKRKKAEEELEYNKFLLGRANEVAKIGYWRYDVAGNTISWNDLALDILGFEKSQKGSVESYMNIVHPEDHAAVQEAIGRSLQGLGVCDIDHRIVMGDGSTRWVHVEGNDLRDDSGNVTGLFGIVQDVTERKNSEQVLREYNERYEIVSRATNDAIWDWDIVRDVEIWNHGLESIFGYKERKIGNPKAWWMGKIHPDDFSEIDRSIDASFRHKDHNWSASYRYRCVDGTYKSVFDRAYIIYDGNRPVRMIGAVQDVTQQKLALEEIGKLSMVASKTSNSVLILTPEGNIEWVNEAFVQLTGYTLPEVAGKTPRSFLSGEETDPETLARIVSELRQNRPISEELIVYSKTGRRYWIRLTSNPVFDDDLKPVHFVSLMSDITDSKEYESRITAVAQELTNLIENANVPIFGLDQHRCVDKWNTVAATVFGYSSDEAMGLHWTSLLASDIHEAVRPIIDRAYQGSPTGTYELPFMASDRRRLVMLASVSPRRDISNRITGLMIVAQDLTELINYRNGLQQIVSERTRELHIALQKEKHLVELKNNFISVASHEFRTPLTTISITNSLLRKYRDRLSPEEIDKKLDGIEKQVRHMTHMLDDVLTIGKAEAGKLAVHWVPIGIREFIDHVVDDVYQSSKHTHLIHVDYYVSIDELNTDEKLMRNILTNLLTNAIKFSPDREKVELSVRSEDLRLIISVRDFGLGIPESEVATLFQPFQRSSNVMSIQGTGLGLSIVKSAVELLGGEISVKSKLHEGSEFTVILPIE